MYMGNVKENVSLGIHVARVATRVIADDLQSVFVLGDSR